MWQFYTSRIRYRQRDAGKQAVPIEVFATRIAAAVLERKRLGPDIVIIARTDALQTHNFDEAIRRLEAGI